MVMRMHSYSEKFSFMASIRQSEVLGMAYLVVFDLLVGTLMIFLFCFTNNTHLSQSKALTLDTCPEFRFTSEKPEPGVLQYLDLKLTVFNCLCWRYGKNESKPPLSAYSMLSISVPNDLINTLFLSAPP